MRKELVFKISEEQNGLAVKAVLSKDVHLSRREISRLKFSGGLLLNGQSCRVTEELHTGDELKLIFMEQDTAHAQRILGKPEILYEDEDLVIVNKPAGMPCHPSHEHLDDDMGTLLQNYYDNGLMIRAVGRLDKDVSGVMVYAKNKPAAARLSAGRTKGTLHKEYLAIVEGRVEQKSGTLEYRLAKKDGRRDRVIDEDGQLCITDFTTEREGLMMSLLRVSIRTGRTHQIRAGMKQFGHPLMGDVLYGGDHDLIHRPALHCADLTLQQPFTGKVIKVSAPMPDDMQALLKMR